MLKQFIEKNSLDVFTHEWSVLDLIKVIVHVLSFYSKWLLRKSDTVHDYLLFIYCLRNAVEWKLSLNSADRCLSQVLTKTPATEVTKEPTRPLPSSASSTSSRTSLDEAGSESGHPASLSTKQLVYIAADVQKLQEQVNATAPIMPSAGCTPVPLDKLNSPFLFCLVLLFYLPIMFSC